MNGTRNSSSEPSSPYDPPEKPLELTTGKRPEKKLHDKNTKKKSQENKAKTRPKSSSDFETSEKLDQDDLLSGNSGSSLALSDLNYGSTEPHSTKPMNKTKYEQTMKTNFPREKKKPEYHEDILQNVNEPKDGRKFSGESESPSERSDYKEDIMESMKEPNHGRKHSSKSQSDYKYKEDSLESMNQPKDKHQLSGKSQSPREKMKSDFNDDILDILSDGSLSLSSDGISDDGGSLSGAMMDSIDAGNLDTNQVVTKHAVKETSRQLNQITAVNRQGNDNKTVTSKRDNEDILTSLSKRDNDDQTGYSKVDSSDAIKSLKVLASPVTSSEDMSPSVSVKGSLSLLKVVDAEVEKTSSPETFYHAPRCSQDMKDDIIG